VNEHRYAHLVARLLRTARGRIGPHLSPPHEDATAQLASVIRSAAARRRRGRLAKLVGAGTGAACLALALVWRWTRPNDTEPVGSVVESAKAPRSTFVAAGAAVATVMDVRGSSRALLSGEGWASGEHLRTADRPANLATKDGSGIDVQPHSDLQLLRADAERRIQLGVGAVEVHVTKLTAGQRFVIETPDAEVEVRGTRFRVSIVPAVDDCGDGTVTRVSVTEGVVVVRSSGLEFRVGAGRRWPTECGEPDVPAQLVPSAVRGAASLRHLRKTSSLPASALEESTSTLATENDLFGAALKAESAGDGRAAVQLLDVLLARFPTSPLKESAALKRAKLIGSIQLPP
jgi:hypothetical protein